MKRSLSAALAFATVAAVAVAAQTPEGWMLRADRSTNAQDPDGAGEIQFTTIPGGFHAVNPAAAIYWNPANTASGTYTLRGTFQLMEPSNHNNFYGLILGGRDLTGMEQHYLYFLVSQDGTYLIKRRLGDAAPGAGAARGRGEGMMRGGGANMPMPPGGQQAGGRGGRGRGPGGPQAITEDVVASTASDAVRTPGADGTSMNALEVRVGAETVDFAVNGTVVQSLPKADLETDGLYGIRVNHFLNVQITNFGVN